MSKELIQKALLQAVVDMDPSFDEDTQWSLPNTNFDKPSGVYAELHVLFAKPLNLEISGTHYWERGFLQISYFWPNNSGTIGPSEKTALIDEEFRFSRTIPYSVDRSVRIIETPEAVPPFTDDDRWVCVHRIPFEAQVTRGT